MENARVEGVGDRVQVKEGDARALPFADETFDVIVSNYVVHELKNHPDRERMMAEISRVLKPGGHVVINDFIFTADCVQDLKKSGVEAERFRADFLSFWLSAVLNFGSVQPYQVIGRKVTRISVHGVYFRPML
jgi:ubiquinone/menaquinone biosynthesis C-methylase UbiE